MRLCEKNRPKRSPTHVRHNIKLNFYSEDSGLKSSVIFEKVQK
jgi:hypothetical protein